MAALIPGMGGWELILILFIVLILFGPKRLPALGKSLGQTMKAIRQGVDGDPDDEIEDEDAPAKPKAKKKSKSEVEVEDEDDDEE